MNPPLRLRVLTRADLAFADSLRALAGWNQTTEDWERLLALEPLGCFLAEWNGAPAGTVTTTVYGQDLAWIGMMLVHPEYRRRGIGRALMEACLEHLRGLGVRCIRLDATPLGKPVYERLGFKEEWTLTRWRREAAPARRREDGPGVRSWRRADLEAIDTLDREAFGVSRRRLLQRLAGQNRCALVMESETGRLVGHGWLRAGAQADYLGPLVAETSDIARQILDGLLERGRERPVFWDIPDANAAAVAWARRHGFTEQRGLTRMSHGEGAPPGIPARQFAIAGPECG